MPDNQAAWLNAKYTQLEVGPAPYTSPKDNEIVVKNRAVAINPVDWFKPYMGDFAFSYIKYPFVLGTDIAGEVVEVGKAVTRFKVGDRIVGQAAGIDPHRNRAAEGAFQSYTVLSDYMASPIPHEISFERAAVLPLATSTASCGLFQKDHLALQLPSVPARPTGQTLLIWGGSTSVGSSAIQLAVAAGYEVITTCSPHNFDYVKKLGASQAFDYNSKSAVADIIKALQGKTVAGALAIGSNSAEACLDIIHASKGKKFVSLASSPIPFDKLPPGPGIGLRILGLVPKFAGFVLRLILKSRPRGIRTNFIFGSSLMHNEVGPAIYANFLPKALATGSFVPAPEPLVIGHGLEAIEKGFQAQRKGVSAKKIVVTL